MDREIVCKLCDHQKPVMTFKLQAGTIYRCPACDLHFSDRRDEIEKIEAASMGLDQRAWEYIETRSSEVEALLEPRLALVKEFLPLAGCRCLDLGAGIGQFLRLLKEELAEGLGIEPSGVRRQYAAKKFGLPLRPELVEADYWQDRFADSFDVICLWDVLEHLNEPLATLHYAFRLLKPGGYLFLDTPNREVSAYRISGWLYRLTRGQVPLALEIFYSAAPYGHKQIFTKAQLRLLWEKLALEEVCLRHSYQGGRARSDKLILVGQKPHASQKTGQE